MLFAAVASAGGLDDFHWREEFADAERWRPRVTWLGNPSRTASVTSDGQVACFGVDEPLRGMKWSASMPMVSLADTPWLVVRYRAEKLNTKRTDYLVYLNDRVRGKELHAIRLCDAVPDGRWHVAAVDVTTLTAGEAVYSMAVQVQASAKGRARLWLDWLAFMDAAPKDAQVLRRVPVVPRRPDWVAPLAQARWAHHYGWLSNPASKGKHSVERRGEATVFRVAEPARGMKWSWDLPEKVPLEGHRYVSMRYRAKGLRAVGDYLLCVIGKPRGDGRDYTSIISDSELISDGRWHTLNVDVRGAAAGFPLIGALAIQVQAASPGASLEVADVRFVNAIQPSKLADAIDWRPGANFDGFKSISLGEAARSQSIAWRRHLRIADWFAAATVTIHGIPFVLSAEEKIRAKARTPSEADLAATGVRAKTELRFPTDLSASEVYLLMLAAFIGPEEPCYGGGKLKVIRDVDRFRLRLEYADGAADECLPMNVATKQFGIVEGPQVVVAAADPSKKLEAVVVRDISKQAAFAIAAVTVRTRGARAFPQALEETPPLRPKPVAAEAREETAIELQHGVTLSSTHVEADIRWRHDGQPLDELVPYELVKLIHRPTGWNCVAAPRPLFELYVDRQRVPAHDFLHACGGWLKKPLGVGLAHRLRGHPGLMVGAAVRLAGDDGFSLVIYVHNGSRESHRIALVSTIGPYRLSERADDAFYLVPRRGAVFDNRPCSYRERYCGLFPVQLLHTFAPSAGRGLLLRTEDAPAARKEYVLDEDDAQPVRKNYLLEKKDGAFTIGVEYPERTLNPGETFETPKAIVALTDGDWHRGLEAYRQWVKSWHRPLSPRKRWFREIFNFRQRFLWSLDPLYDAKTGTFHLERAIEEGRREFGGIDYLHIFDWGNCGKYGRIYGRTGDYSPYDYLKGGRDAFRQAIAGVQKRGVPVGLYIEGYLLQEKGKLGQKFGQQWQLTGSDGKGRYWPNSTEMIICPFVREWRQVQASTYATKVRELDVDGMYLDELGFAGRGRDCWSKDHGHPVPSYVVLGEHDLTKMVRQRIEDAKKGVALYTEESPVDVTSQYQDGSFTYAMFSAQRTHTRVPLNLYRFAFPDFKTIEILYCDKPTGSWATGVRWVFFNGEAIWLEGPAETWFEPETRAAIRRCYRILRKHRDAFTSLEPVPLVPTEMGGVFANKFPTKGKTVYTLYNSRHRTVRGEVLRIPHRQGATYYDEWHQCPALVRREGKDVILSTELGPHGTGCLVVKRD